ncbi:MAG: hypothetical protein SFW09_01815 [Hyphomicrobiaceae bacterium]|nr:hypothetical protein [Hyphomicrobiaceae bacterium]
MRVALPDWTSLALFAGWVLAVTLYGLALSAHFPAEHRRASLKDGIGAAVLWGTLAIATVSAMLAVRFALEALPGYAAVIAAGLAILVAPLALKPLPDSLIDDRSGLILLAGLTAALAAVALDY